MESFNKTKVPITNVGKTRMDLSCDHITTSNFMELQPVYYRHCIPGEKISVNANAFSRLAPMSVPTYGRARRNLRAFFVPFEVVDNSFKSFKEDTIHSGNLSSALVMDTIYCTNEAFIDFFVNSLCSVQVTPPAAYDFVFNSNYYALTNYGRRAMKVLHSLGYRWSWRKNTKEKISLLALLCFVRLYCDWYSVNQYLNSSDYLGLMRYFNYNEPISLALNDTDLIAIFNFVQFVPYDDFFTSVWDNPVAPAVGNYSPINFEDVSQGLPINDQVVNTSLANGTPQMQQFVNGSLGTQYLHTALKAITDYSRKHAIVGARVVDRALVDYGVQLKSEILSRSIYLGSASFDVEIGDVMSHADTSGASLGDYAGRGFSNGNKSFEYTPEYFGLFVIVSSIQPYAGYWQGMDRNNLHISKLDFFTKDFDALSTQVVTRGEVYSPLNDTFESAVGELLKAFGYASRYYEYKRAVSWIDGDLELPSVNSGGDAWHLFRTFKDSDFSNTSNNLVHSRSFCEGSFDADQYNRIFDNTSPNADKFYDFYHFGVMVEAPCKSLFDSYEFDNAGKEITLDGGTGPKLN